MPRIPVRILLFVSSYAPLIALLGFRSRQYLPTLLALEALAFGSVLLLWLLLRLQRGHADTTIRIAAWDTKDGDALGYVASYLVPLLGLDPGRLDDVLALGVFALVLGVIYCNSSLIYTNPMLSLLGYHLFVVQESAGPTWTVLAHRTHLNVAEIQTARVGDTMIRIER